MADITINQLPNNNSPTTSLQIPVTDGTTTTRVTISQILGLQSGVPIGTIVMWSNRGGAGIPSGWQLCDGTNGTPDLRNRFIVGSGSSYAIGNTGGVDSVSLSVAQLPAHNHGISDPGHSHGTWPGCGRSAGGGCVGGNNGRVSTSTGAAGTGISILNTGGGGSHENRPPYYALAYIQKVS